MKRKIIIIIIIIILLGLITGLIVLNNQNTSIITMDINPSIKIYLNKNNIVKRVKAINNDAKEIITNNFKGKTIDETLKMITDKVIEKDYIENNMAIILINSTGNIDNEYLKQQIEQNFIDRSFQSEVIIVNNITKEDKATAKKYNITPAKASYVNSVSKENQNIDIVTLSEKSVNQLKEMKDTGNYCEDGYNLEGDFCFKEIERITASEGKVCPNGYYEYNSKCYEESDKLVCPNEFELKDGKCHRTISIDAEPSKYNCPQGEAKTRAEVNLTSDDAGDANNIVCVDYSSATHPVSPCEANDGTEYTLSGGKCYWHRAPVIESGCPGKIQVNGECWDDASGIYICVGYRDGKQYKSKNEYCEHSIKYLDPIVTEYKCPKTYNIDNNKCIKEEIGDPQHERFCQEGYTLLEDNHCINYNKTTDKIDGYVCNQDNAKIKNDTCIIYDIVEAKHNN